LCNIPYDKTVGRYDSEFCIDENRREPLNYGAIYYEEEDMAVHRIVPPALSSFVACLLEAYLVGHDT